MIFRRKFFLLFILILGLSLRLINLSEWFHFEMDEEVIAWKLRPFLQEGKPFLIGGGTPFGFHLGPAFYYLSSIPLFFSRLDPIGWGVAAAIFGTVTIGLMWLTGKNLYGRRVGMMAALMWATSFTAVMSDRHWWPLVLDPMLSLVVILCLYKICVIPAKAGIYLDRFRVRHGMTWIVLGTTLAFAWQADLTVLPLFLAAGVVAIINFRRQWKGILAAAGILLVSFLPLILFEFRHPGQNFGKLFAYEFLRRPDPAAARLPAPKLQRGEPAWQAGSGLKIKQLAETIVFIPQSLSRLVFPITNFDGNLQNFYTWCREIADARVAGQPWWAAGVTIFWVLIPFMVKVYQTITITLKTNDDRRLLLKSGSAADKVLRLIIISAVAGILVFKLFGGNLYDFYLAILYPVIILLAARSIDFIWRKWGILAGGAIALLIVALNLAAVARAYHPQGLTVKQRAVAWAAEQLKGKDFELDSLSECSRYNGVRYLFSLENMEPAKSFVDQDLSWLYQSYDGQSKPEYLVTFVTYNDLTGSDRERYDQLQTLSVAVKRFEDLEVLILINRR